MHVAAIEAFSARGYRQTSMADIAAAAGMSRPALYQYFANKSDVFAQSFVALFESHAARALAALADATSTVEALDGFLQRFDGDLYERMASSAFTEELIALKSAGDTQRIEVVVEAMWHDVAQCLGGGGDAVARVIEMLRLAPKGFRDDAPSVEVYRARLRSLAELVTLAVDE